MLIELDTKIVEMDVFENWIVLYERCKGIPQIRISNRQDSSHFKLLPIPQEHILGHVSPNANQDFHTDTIRFTISTPLVIELIYEYNMPKNELRVVEENQVPSNVPVHSTMIPFLRDQYTIRQESVMAKDGTSIPMTLVHNVDMIQNAQNPLLSVGYGAYGVNNDTSFHVEYLSLLCRNWILALPHVRGGGELGFNWHNQGRQQHKLNTFTDYVACMQHLISEKYTNSNLLVGSGTSAGTMILGYVANEHPTLMRAMVLNVPFVDVLSTMMDPSLPLTVHEYDEWGDPQDAQVFEYIRKYSPCDNIRHQNYPSMLITGSLNDQRVPYQGVLKYYDKISKSTLNNAVYLSMDEHDSHLGNGGKLDFFSQAADAFAFLHSSVISVENGKSSQDWR